MNDNYDDIDNLLLDYFKYNEYVPNIITNGIENAINNKNKKYKVILLIKKFIITMIGILTITGGIVFAKDIKIFVNTLIENIYGNYNNGITTAINNGYSQDIDMKYIESNNIKVKVNQITMDDYNLGIIFNIEIEQIGFFKDLYNVQFKNLLIMDENNNVIFAEYENQEEFVKYCDENNLDKGTYGIGYANCGANGSILNIQNNNIVYSFYTTSEKFPQSKKLTIKFDKIYLLNNKIFDEVNNKKVDNHIATIDGNWNIDIDLGKMSSDRDSIDYIATNINDNNTTVTKASLSMTNMKLELITNSDKIDFKKLQERRNMSVRDMIPFSGIYIQTLNGNKFFQSNSGSNGYDTLDDGKIRYYTTFDYTYFDKTENIKIVLPTNKGENLIIELKVKKDGTQ